MRQNQSMAKSRQKRKRVAANPVDLDRPHLGSIDRRFRTKAVDLGECALSNVDNVAEVLAIVEFAFPS
jgi:hypothetical protein